MTLAVSVSLLHGWAATGATPGSTGQGDMAIGDLGALARSRAKGIADKLDEVRRLADEARAREIAIDYERVVIATAEDFIGCAIDDVEHSRVARALHVVEALDVALNHTGEQLREHLVVCYGVFVS